MTRINRHNSASCIGFMLWGTVWDSKETFQIILFIQVFR